ncbi:MAG: HAMP domain-containing histidine kinase [Oscillospiraceae bacterium]|nr:HAMP domain-containing histidine kinase [Oscillospiraceae bacterium]
MNSVYLKNTLLLAGLVVLSFFVFLVSFAIILRNQTIADQRAGLEANASSIVDMYNYVSNFNPNREEDHEMINLVVSIVTLPHNRMLVTDSHGVVIACSEPYYFCQHLGLVLPTGFQQLVDQQGSLSVLSSEGIPDLIEGDSFVHLRPILGLMNDTHGGYVLVASSAEAVMEEWGAMLSIFLLVAATVLLMAIVLAMLVARHQAAPLREMSSAVSKFALGDFSTRVVDRGREDEIGELTDAFNAMADAIEQSEDMRREFVGNVSHELKTPMTSITGFAEGILDGTIPPEKQTEYLQIISSETRRLSRLVLKMLEVSRFQSMDIRELSSHDFDVTEVLRRGILGLESKITARGLNVALNLPEGEVMVLGDEDSIIQVAYNLLDNAAKFSSPGSTIEVSLTQKAGKAYVTVRNLGQAIAPEELPLLFNRFHKNDKSRSNDKDGIGLGLYIVKTIMNAHHEEVMVRSENGVTEFMFTLTLAPKKKKS